MNRYHYEYSMTMSRLEGKPEHAWTVRCARGGVVIHLRESDSDGFPAYGGVEIHHAFPVNDTPPSHIHCTVSGGKCWHEGSSGMADPMVEHFAKHGLPNHESMFRQAMSIAEDHLYKEQDDD